MDAECARADLEALRQDVWSSVDAKVNRVNKFNFKIFNIAIAALILILMTAAPARNLNNIKPEEIKIESKNEIELKAENKNKINLNNNNKIEKNIVKLNNNNLNKNLANKKVKAAKAYKPEKNIKAANIAVKAEKNLKVLPYDKMFSLLETGSRALRGSSAIEIK
ncbi:MAG: hypothetical protein II870_00840 [Synergistaceae bacterium]|nr:hypothetical protein [Synergistaceae bacterium]MBR0221223.1 hypothetical protein [Synergistaceae bacterium]